jgi:DNA repair protein RadC
MRKNADGCRTPLSGVRHPLASLRSGGSPEYGEPKSPPAASSGTPLQFSFDFTGTSDRHASGVRMGEKGAELPLAFSLSVADSIPLDTLCAYVRSRLEDHFRRADVLSSPEIVKRYLMSRFALLESEVFAVLFLDNRHRVLAFEELFYGTIDGCAVHPREVVKRTLHHNAAALIFAHNHPSGNPTASQADKALTQRLKDILALIDVRVLDHIVIGGAEAVSFAERGLL